MAPLPLHHVYFCKINDLIHSECLTGDVFHSLRCDCGPQLHRAMRQISDEDFPSVEASAHAVIREAKAAGVYVFGGGIDETVPPVMVTGEGKVSPETYPETSGFNGGFCVLKVQTREEAERWAAKIAAGCWCAQELRQFMYDPES